MLLVYTLDIAHQHMYRPGLFTFSSRKEENYGSARSSPRRQRSSALHLVFSNLLYFFSKTKRPVATGHFVLGPTLKMEPV